MQKTTDTVVALDPGETTGYAILSGAEVETGSVTSLSDLWELLTRHRPGHLIVERFVGGKRSRPASFEIIGIIRLYSELWHAKLELVPPPRKAGRPRGDRHAAVAAKLLEQYIQKSNT